MEKFRSDGVGVAMGAQAHMQRALALAKQAWGQTYPNPMVGCVIARGDEVLAEGFHVRAGQPHAERLALRALAEAGIAVEEDMVMYVTLEPCSTEGKTGACTEAILAAGIGQVVVGCLDPNPAHAGAGIDVLREAGIAVEVGLLQRDCSQLNVVFNQEMTRAGDWVAGLLLTDWSGDLLLGDMVPEPLQLWPDLLATGGIDLLRGAALVEEAWQQGQVDYLIWAQYGGWLEGEKRVCHMRPMEKITESLRLQEVVWEDAGDWRVMRGWV